MEDLVQPTLVFISTHAGWAFAVMFVTAFGESFVFLSLLFPGTSLLIAAGALIATGTLPYLPVLAGRCSGPRWATRCRFGSAAGLAPLSAGCGR